MRRAAAIDLEDTMTTAGTWRLCTRPRDGAYQGVLHGKYGETVPLPAPIAWDLPTDGLPLYGSRR